MSKFEQFLKYVLSTYVDLWDQVVLELKTNFIILSFFVFFTADICSDTAKAMVGKTANTLAQIKVVAPDWTIMFFIALHS